MPGFDVEKIRKDFPVLAQKMNGHNLVYLDNAATTQKPAAVLDRMDRFYREEYATVHRGVYTLSQKATRVCDDAREKCRRFLGAKKTAEIIFVRGATEAINLVAHAFGRKFFNREDEIIISVMEHHANIVPWQRLCEEKGLTLRVIPMNDRGDLDLEEYRKMLSGKTRLVALTHVSNALGTVNPVKEMTEWAHEEGAVVLLDGAQGVVHEKVNVQELGCDFYCFSAHKIYGPTGVGVLYGKLRHLEAMDPYQTGGDMIESVTFERTSFAKPPYKFEAGTPAIVEIVGLGAALDYLEALGWDAIRAHERDLLQFGTQALSAVRGLRLIGTAREKVSVLSFVMEDIHPHDVGTILDQEGIAIRTGHHCAQPVMQRFGLPATARASFALYNTREEIRLLAESLEKVKEVFR